MQVRGVKHHSTFRIRTSFGAEPGAAVEEVQYILLPVPPVASASHLVSLELPTPAPSPDRAEMHSEEVRNFRAGHDGVILQGTFGWSFHHCARFPHMSSTRPGPAPSGPIGITLLLPDPSYQSPV